MASAVDAVLALATEAAEVQELGTYEMQDTIRCSKLTRSRTSCHPHFLHAELFWANAVEVRGRTSSPSQ